MTRTLSSLRSTPVIWAQVGNVVAALVTYSLVARGLPRADFARYAALSALFAVGNAGVGFALGVEVMAGAARDAGRVAIRARALLEGALLLALLTIVGGSIVGVTVEAVAVSVVCQWSWCSAELAAGHALGRHRFGKYASLTFGRLIIWVLGTLIAISVFRPADRLGGVLVALALSGIVPLVYLARSVSIRFGGETEQVVSRRHLSVYQIAMWITGSADRVIFAHVAPISGASYAAIYGVLDRGFRTLATTELLQRLPRVFSTSPRTGRAAPRLVTVPGVIVMVVAASVAAPWIVRLLTGGRYSPGYLLSGILAASLGLMLAATPRVAELVGRDRSHVLARGATAVAAVNVSANCALIPTVGAVGAAIANLLSYGLWFAIVLYQSRRLLRERSTESGQVVGGSAPAHALYE